MLKKYCAWLGIIIIFVLAFCLRFYQLGNLPNGIYWDEVAMLVDAKSISQTGHDMHGRVWYQVLYPSYGDYKLPIYIWLAGATVKVFGVSAWALRFPSFIAGLVTIITSGLIGYLWTTRVVKNGQPRLAMFIGLATMLVIAVSPWSIMFSRTAFEGHVAQALVAVSVLTLILGHRSRKWWLLSAALGAMATYTYFSVRFVWPPVFISLAVSLLFEPGQLPSKKTRNWWIETALSLMVPLIVFGLILVPMARSPLYGDSNRFRLGTDSVLKNETEILQSNIYREIAGNTPIDRILFHRAWLTARELLLNYSDNVSLNFMFVTGDPNLRHGTGEFGLFLAVFFPFFIWGWYQLFTSNKRLAVSLLVWWLAALLPASVPENTPHALRSLNALVPLSLVIGFGLGSVIEMLCQAWTKKRQTLITRLGSLGALTWFIGLVFSVTQFAVFYFQIYPTRSFEAWQFGYPQVAQAMLELRDSEPMYVESFDDKFYLWLMAYGPYTGRDFAGWPSYSYQFRSFDAIYFSPFPGWDSVPNQDSRAVVAGRVEAISKLVATQPVRVIEQKQIPDPSGNPLFQVVVIEKKL